MTSFKQTYVLPTVFDWPCLKMACRLITAVTLKHIVAFMRKQFQHNTIALVSGLLVDLER